ncbi:uncharacterized protein BO97DRAFT_374714 [Aspergillus homomorphus CBS 101889]|uniref:Uncharacterized protein n=1 Tax=Aspergillus homomorphus (strain CBS 101889) TaxID=1450537 RepID=A0A395HPK6_ASPHC|nr:hypothetical protein BO97DRAFT_374714 [Aspergillus homomorphus CBS 101889]RAL09556.1 hypothetical protein BO97DRAFT_374714 [Aspergillus homomorphus CBS 101889]
MLLTLKPSSQNGVKGPHDYAIVRQSVPTPRSSPSSVPDRSTATAPSRPSADHSMDSSRSGLPPPASLTLPPPNRSFASGHSPGNAMNPALPPPPGQWQSSDESMRHWLQAKAEEDRRKQEEEKTRQESLRLEQRRLEQSMLRDALQAGIPPHLIPLIFAGISPGGLPPSILEMVQQHMAQSVPPRGSAPSMSGLSHAPTQHQRRPSHVRRDSRNLPLNPYPAPSVPAQAVPPPGILLSQPLHPVGTSPTVQPLTRPPVTNNAVDARLPPAVPRMPLGEPQLQPPPPINLSHVHYAPGSSIPVTQPATGKSDPVSRPSPPSLYFHHWVPPGQPPANPVGGRTRQDSPGPPQGPRRVESHSSPGRKRKATGPHIPAPMPSSRGPEPVPGSSTVYTSQPGSPTFGDPRLSVSNEASSYYDLHATEPRPDRPRRGPSPDPATEDEDLGPHREEYVRARENSTAPEPSSTRLSGIQQDTVAEMTLPDSGSTRSPGPPAGLGPNLANTQPDAPRGG